MMTTVTKLLAKKQQMIERLEKECSLRERDEIERLISKIDDALTWLEHRAEKSAIGGLSRDCMSASRRYGKLVTRNLVIAHVLSKG
jgi:hypothetical protein